MVQNKSSTDVINTNSLTAMHIAVTETLAKHSSHMVALVYDLLQLASALVIAKQSACNDDEALDIGQ